MNILLSSTGRKTYMIQYFKEILNGSGKIFASNNVMTYSLAQADGYLITTQMYDDSYIAALIDFCQANQINCIMPLSDADLPILAKNRERLLNHHISVVVSNESVIETCNDKWKTYQFLSSLGLPQPKTYIDPELAKQDIKSGNLTFPLILKPRCGAEYMSVVEVDTIDELNIFYQRVHHDILKSYLRDICQKEDIIIQEKIEGEQYSLDILNDLEGNYITTVAKQIITKDAGKTLVAKTVNNQPFENSVKLITSHLKPVAAIDADCFITDSGNAIILEINGRTGNQYPFAHLAGVDFPKQIIEWIKGAQTSKKYISFELGVTGKINSAPAKQIYF